MKKIFINEYLVDAILYVIFIIALLIAAIHETKAQQVGEVVGKVYATDPDSGTVLTYKIIEGNRGNAFCFGNPYQLGPDHTGIIRVKNPAAIIYNKRFRLVIQVNDNGIPGSPAQCKALATVRITWNYEFIVEPL